MNSDQHMQPMTHYTDRDTAEIWFITSAQTDLVQSIGLGARAHYCLMTTDGAFYASLTGTLEQSEDREKLGRLWSSVASVWFTEGRHDPRITLLRLAVQEAAIWATTGSPMTFGLEIVRATLEKDH